jgi:hypothetical protein
MEKYANASHLRGNTLELFLDYSFKEMKGIHSSNILINSIKQKTKPKKQFDRINPNADENEWKMGEGGWILI